MRELLIPNQIVQEMKVNAFLKDRTIYLTEDITNDTELTVNRMFEKIVKRDEINNIEPKNADPIKLKISSYGGLVTASLSIISTIETLKEKGYRVHGYSYGVAMSGAFKIFISCSKRYAQKNTMLMYHQPSNFQYGHSDVEDKERALESSRVLWEACKDVIKKYTSITEEHLNKITVEKRDVYLFGKDGFENNIVDELF